LHELVPLLLVQANIGGDGDLVLSDVRGGLCKRKWKAIQKTEQLSASLVKV
jgi:hypothetical protein